MNEGLGELRVCEAHFCSIREARKVCRSLLDIGNRCVKRPGRGQNSYKNAKIYTCGGRTNRLW